ncbi:MAG TPA: ferritin family protein [Thermodesulfovibrionales bacterium]|nr:ferritin family protein [Thermodesulfovibrionales bacterium]
MNAMTIAIKTETDAIAFYKEAAQRTRNPMGRKMFLSIIRDEQNHLEDFRRIVHGLHLKVRGEDGKTKKMKTVFDGNRDALLGRIRAATDEIEVLRLAIQIEKESIAFYEKLSSKAKTPKEKALFRRLLKEEQQHYAVFSNTYFFLSNSENWFMWEEHSIADGGTPWA